MNSMFKGFCIMVEFKQKGPKVLIPKPNIQNQTFRCAQKLSNQGLKCNYYGQNIQFKLSDTHVMAKNDCIESLAVPKMAKSI